MKRPRLSKLMTWERHVSLVLGVLLEALTSLRGKSALPQSEVDLNRELYWCLLEANRKLLIQGEALDHAPVPEGKNPPDPDDLVRTQRENKIPDFYWGFIDHTELDPRRSARNFFIECKRIGKPTRLDWILNENYIRHGVLRFITEEHAYAKGEKSGAMVGYVQSMEFDEILDEVNQISTTLAIPLLLGPIGGWHKDGTSTLEHELPRPFRISPFYLQHFWVDLRR